MEEYESKRKLSRATMETVRPETKRLKSTEPEPVHVHDVIGNVVIGNQDQGCHISAMDVGSSQSQESGIEQTHELEIDVPPANEVTSEEREVLTQMMENDGCESDNDMDMFDESMCFRESSDVERQRCQLLKRLSDQLMGYDDVDGPNCDSLESDGIGRGADDVISYLQSNVASDTKTLVAQYLSSGSLEFIHLTLENLHHIYHVAWNLRLKQLSDHCFKFCSQHNQEEIMRHFEGCECLRSVKRQSADGFQRSQSIVSNPDDNEPPQYFIVFTGRREKGKSQVQAVNVMVINMTEKMDVYHKRMDRLSQFGNGFACCSLEIKESPYVFVSGGEAKGHNMFQYDVLLGRWNKCAKMIHGRSQHMMAAWKQSVFVLGGADVACIEEYDIKKNKWYERAALVTTVTHAACVTCNGKIYVLGGKTNAGPVATVQCFDSERHSILKLQDLPVAFEGGQGVVFNGLIYIATFQGHLIRFDPQTEQSSLCSQPPLQRRNFGMFVKNERIYFVGGELCDLEGTAGNSPQYRYNPEKDFWVEKFKMNLSYPVVASCVVRYPQKCSIVPFNDNIF